MRATIALSMIALLPATALAAEGEKTNLLMPAGGLMFWTLIIFIGLMFVLTKFAYRPLLEAVEAREAALEAAIAGAQRDREAAAKLLAEQTAALDHARAEAQRFIADGRATSETLKASMLQETKAQQQEMLDRARRELEGEKVRAIAELRREAVDLALAGASKVIAKNMDDAANRKLVEEFLASIPAQGR
jgi:F-type H+-transporting ATPase subunit b